KIYIETKLGELEQDAKTYLEFNRQTNIRWKKSFQTFLDAKVFKYKKGIISRGNERFFLMEVSGMYLFEKGMKNKKMKEIMFESAFSVGQEIFMDMGGKDIHGIMELLSALGFGELSIYFPSGQMKVIITHFPWTKYYKEIDYLFIRGLLSGIFSHIYKKNFCFKKPKIDILSGNLSLIFEH
ncbi:MAG: hypothetical protein KAI55_04190, partial [Candidatus Aenigmarchaeota archaeon]|nr:hypothetical protein [Candidatus Aenigmarchaeota archaeon]